MSLVGNRRYRTLHVGQQITVALGLPSRKFHLETIFIVIRILRGRGRIEQECGPGNREQLYGPQFDICGLDGNRIRDFRDAAPDFDSRQGQHTTGRRTYRNVAFIGHRKHIILVGMRDDEILRCRTIAQIAAQVGGDTHPVVAGQTLEAQRRRGLVTVQDDLAVIVAEVVQVPNRSSSARDTVIIRSGRTDISTRIFIGRQQSGSSS